MVKKVRKEPMKNEEWKKDWKTPENTLRHCINGRMSFIRSQTRRQMKKE